MSKNTKYKVVNNSQDKLMRKILSDKEEAASFINKALNLRYNFMLEGRDLENYTTTFVNKGLENRVADIIYKIINKEKIEGEVYILIEHQSRVDYSMPYRILEYKGELLKIAIDEKKSKTSTYKSPTVISIVIYTGRRKWKVKDLEENKSYIRGREDIKFTDIIVSGTDTYTDKEAIQSREILPKVLSLDKRSSTEELEDMYKKITRNRLSKRNGEMLKAYTNNIMRNILEKVKTEELIKNIKIEKEEEPMFEIVGVIKKEIRDSRKKGLAEGITKGERIGKVKTAKAMLKEKMDIESIAKVTGLRKAEIVRLQKA